jgi:hypothetical protein
MGDTTDDVTCAGCGGPLRAGFYLKDGKYYCAKCYCEKFGRCAG